MRTLIASLALLVPLALAPVRAQNAPAADDPPERYLDSVVVTGAQPGPGMWRVRRGDHVLWIMGTLSPLPKKLDWRPRELEAVIAEADVILGPPTIIVGTNIGMLRGLTLLPAAMKARNNPGGKQLQDVVPAPLYARWQPLKARYFGRSRGIEKRRPVEAGSALFSEAVKRAGMRFEDPVMPLIVKGAKARGMRIEPVSVSVPVKDPRGVLKRLRHQPLDDLACFEKTVERVESDIGPMALRARAWAVGDIDALRALPERSHDEACIGALTGSAVARELGVGDLSAMVSDTWLARARRALDEHDVGLAVAPVDELIRPGGLLERLRALGYEVEAP